MIKVLNPGNILYIIPFSIFLSTDYTSAIHGAILIECFVNNVLWAKFSLGFNIFGYTDDFNEQICLRLIYFVSICFFALEDSYLFGLLLA